MSERVALITGGASGIGLATADRLNRDGWRVTIADRNPPPVSLPARFVETDVTDTDAVAALVDGIVASEGRLDGLVNAAGIRGHRAAIAETDMQAARHEMDVHVFGTLNLIRACAPHMQAARSGSIVNIASVAGLTAGWGSHVYSAAKAAVIQLTRTVAAELGEDSIRVNCICPGPVLTPIFARGLAETPNDMAAVLSVMEDYLAGTQPIPRAGLPSDVAETVAFLLDDGAAFVTGQTIAVDGGLTAGRKWSEAGTEREKRQADITARLRKD